MPKTRFEDGERMDFDHGHALFLPVAGQTLTRYTCEPGWQWTQHLASQVGSERCPAHHRLVVLSGSMTIEDAQGATTTLDAGDVLEVHPGHDAWTEGDEPAVVLDVPVA